MSQQYFTDEEWSALMQTPIHAISAVVLSDKSDPVTFLKEVKAAMQLLMAEKESSDISSDLGRSLMQSFKEKMATEPMQGEQLLMKQTFEYLGNLETLKSAADGRKISLDHLHQVATILASKVTVIQAQDFRQWLLSLARKVAEAVKEEGFMGIGGERVSRPEASTLKAIEQALAVKA
jgi:hypothetical protein